MSKKSIPRIVVSGLRGGGGKTVLSLSLAALLRQKGLRVTPFKKGPDYIDAGWLAKASGAACYNLDLFMMTPEQVLQSFIAHTTPPHPPLTKGGERGSNTGLSHIAIIEGNRGLYDGMDHKGTYSTAELAKLIKAPVVIIIDCTKTTNTVAALVLGCQQMDPGVTIAGVVLNRVATKRQEAVIRKAIQERCNIPVLGAIPRLKKDPFPERHMGLTPFQEHAGIDEAISAVQEIGTQYLDLDAILKIAEDVRPLMQNTERRTQNTDKSKEKDSLGSGVCGLGSEKKSSPKQSKTVFTNLQPPSPNPAVKIGIIRDSAFQFYYQENFEELEKRGAELIEVSPLREKNLPDIDALYIGGGFPETHAIALAENTGFRDSLYKAVQDGLPVYAECGGLMYLGRELVLEGRTYPMVGALPISFGLEKRPHAHGYTIIEVARANPFFPLKGVFRGHEFHYSKVLEIEEDGTCFAFTMQRGKGIVDNRDGICYKNVLAAYTHLHAIGTPEWADGMARCAGEYKSKRKNL